MLIKSNLYSSNLTQLIDDLTEYLNGLKSSLISTSNSGSLSIEAKSNTISTPTTSSMFSNISTETTQKKAALDKINKLASYSKCLSLENIGSGIASIKDDDVKNKLDILKQLESVYLANNQLTVENFAYLKNTLLSGKKLSILDLRNNALKDLPDINDFTQLRKLDLR